MRAFTVCLLFSLGCQDPAGSITTTMTDYSDDFEREDLGAHYAHRGGSYRLLPGPTGSRALSTLGDRNLPLWLRHSLGRNVRVEVDVVPVSPSVDVKMELFGDGLRHESGYIVILGGWNNTLSVIAKQDEHQRGRVEARLSLSPRQPLRLRVERNDGHTLIVFLDDREVMRLDDPSPLFGDGHDRLAFSSWESDAWFDNLRITALP